MHKRFFFLEASNPYDNLYVCVRAVNGEGDESENLYAYNLSTMADTSRFGITVLSDGLNELGRSGDMAYEGWYSGSPHNLFIVNANKYEKIDDEEYRTWSVSLDGWNYEEESMDPLDADKWDEWNPVNEWYLRKPWRDVNNRDEMDGLALGSEISVEYIDGYPRMAFGAIGELVGEYPNEQRNGYIYSVIPNQNPTTFLCNQGVAEHFYDLSVSGNVMRQPVDLTPHFLGYSQEWPEESDRQQEFDVVHAACVVDANLQYAWYQMSQSQTDYQIRDDITGWQGGMMESIAKMDGYYFGTQPMPSFTLWGRHPEDELGLNLFLYWHVFREDLLVPPLIDNTLWPELDNRDEDDLSWNVASLCEKFDFVQGTDESYQGTGAIGVPASMTLRDVDETQTAFVVFNAMDAAPGSETRQGIGLLATSGPTDLVIVPTAQTFPS